MSAKVRRFWCGSCGASPEETTEPHGCCKCGGEYVRAVALKPIGWRMPNRARGSAYRHARHMLRFHQGKVKHWAEILRRLDAGS